MEQLTVQQWLNDIVVTRRLIRGRTLYFPRNRRTLERLYRIDSIKSGFERQELPRNTVVVDPNDEIIKGG